MSDGYLLIGAFSRACLLPTGTLRFYHEAGILVPAKIDPATGYRAYDPDQLRDAAVIRACASSTCRWTACGRSSRPATPR